jgi:methylenetetrahydrofolate dehydrogenase (NADP+)/methenyltetrahydrofolate cyclohydrolase
VSFLLQTNARAVPAQILDGRAVANELRAELVAQSNSLRERGIHPRLVIVLVGENESSVAYVRNLVKMGERVAIAVNVDQLPETSNAAAVRERLEALALESSVHGVMLQQPLPAHLSIHAIADSIPIHKDVDGTHPGTEFVPATPAAVMLLLERSPHWPLTGRHAVMIGRSVVVGVPVALLMLSRNATVTILHSKSAGLQPYVKMADVLVVAAGVPNLIGGSDIKPGATVIDVGTTLVEGQLKGDVDFDSAVKVAGAITPVPGGVGPVTNIALLRNVIKAASNAGKLNPRD